MALDRTHTRLFVLKTRKDRIEETSKSEVVPRTIVVVCLNVKDHLEISFFFPFSSLIVPPSTWLCDVQLCS